MGIVLLILWPVAELFVAIEVARAIGVLETIVLLIIGWPLGLWALRTQGGAAWRRLNLALSERRTPTREVLDGTLVLFGGLLLMIPGFITDVLGIALLLPPTRALVRPLLVRNLGSRVVLRASGVRPVGSQTVRRRLDGTRYRPAPAPVVSSAPTGTVRTLAFGEIGTGVWVCAWADAETCVVVAGAADAPAAAIPGAALNGISAGEQWSVIADGLELIATSQGETADLAAFDGFDQLCEVTGTVRLGGVEHPIVALGRRGLRAGIDLSRLDSLRDLGAWFAADDGLTLTAARPRGAKGHDRDVIAASVFSEDGAKPVADPRLSSTYSSDGRLLVPASSYGSTRRTTNSTRGVRSPTPSARASRPTVTASPSRCGR